MAVYKLNEGTNKVKDIYSKEAQKIAKALGGTVEDESYKDDYKFYIYKNGDLHIEYLYKYSNFEGLFSKLGYTCEKVGWHYFATKIVNGIEVVVESKDGRCVISDGSR